MKKNFVRIFGVAASLTALAMPAMAHPSADHASGLVHGFMHPVSGFDHVLAMLAVGLLAVRLGGKAIWAVPAAFMSVMALAAAVSFAGFQVPFAEYGIATSIIVLAGLALVGTRLPVAAAASIVAFFAVFHGFAHGAELPANTSGLAFAAGFLLATGLLHAAGIAIGMLARRAFRVARKGVALR